MTAADAYGDFARRYPTDSRCQSGARVPSDFAQGGRGYQRRQRRARGICARRRRQSTSRPIAPRGRVGLRSRTACSSLSAIVRCELVIAKTSQLTAAGVKRASAPKLELLNALTKTFTRAIEAGDPEYLSAATYYIGVAQWEYGNFLKDVQLPASLTDAERAAAAQGAAGQAGGYYDQAKRPGRLSSTRPHSRRSPISGSTWRVTASRGRCPMTCERVRAACVAMTLVLAAASLGAQEPSKAPSAAGRPKAVQAIEIRGQVPTPQVVTVRPRQIPIFSRRRADTGFFRPTLLGIAGRALRDRPGFVRGGRRSARGLVGPAVASR